MERRRLLGEIALANKVLTGKARINFSLEHIRKDKDLTPHPATDPSAEEIASLLRKHFTTWNQAPPEDEGAPPPIL